MKYRLRLLDKIGASPAGKLSTGLGSLHPVEYLWAMAPIPGGDSHAERDLYEWTHKVNQAALYDSLGEIMDEIHKMHRSIKFKETDTLWAVNEKGVAKLIHKRDYMVARKTAEKTAEAM